MATPYNLIFDLFLNENGHDHDLLSLSDDLLVKRLFLYLKTGIATLDKRIYYDISSSNRTDIENVFYDKLTTDGTSTIVLDPNPPANSHIFLKINENEISEDEFTFDGVNTITTSDTFEGDLDIYVGAYTDGQFNDDLNDTAQNILKTIMQMSHINYKKYRDEFLNFQVYGKDFNIHSPANHLGTIQGLSKDQKEEVENMIMDYSYNHASPELYSQLKGV